MNYRKSLFKWFGIGLVMAAGCAVAQTTANGPYYATPSWDQTMPSTTRFVVLTNFNSEAVLDRETGLVWQKKPSTYQLAYAQAFNYCTGTSSGGRYGWRMPTVAELLSLIERPAVYPISSFPVPSGHPFVLPPLPIGFWSGTAAPDMTNVHLTVAASSVGVYAGFPEGDTDETSALMTWCVRASDR